MQAGRRMGLVCGVIAAVCVGGVASRASAQCSDLSPAVALGPVDNPGAVEQVMAATIVSRPGAPSIRVYFAGGEVLGKGTYLRITSVADGLSQRIDSNEIVQWRWSSAWFNGDSVLLELVCGPSTSGNTITVTRSCEIGAMPAPELGCNQCFAMPPPSNELWSARMVNFTNPYYCSAAMWSTHSCLVSAAHCRHPVGSVAQFNVPPSTPAGVPVHPAPHDQYVVTGRQDGFIATQDWSVMTTATSAGLSAFQRQGQLRRIGSQVTRAMGDAIRTPGYGLSPDEMGPQNLAQKVTVGQVTSATTFNFYYDGYSQSGNSGGGITTKSGAPGAVETLGGVFSAFCFGPICPAAPPLPGGGGEWTLAFGVNIPGFVAARQSLCGDCIRDCNGDGLITTADRIILLGWLSTNDPMGDLNGDGFADNVDLVLFDSGPIGAACVFAAE